MKKYIVKPVALLCVGIAFYIYYGIYWNAWRDNLYLLLLYIVILAALGWAEFQKEKIRKEREKLNN